MLNGFSNPWRGGSLLRSRGLAALRCCPAWSESEAESVVVASPSALPGSWEILGMDTLSVSGEADVHLASEPLRRSREGYHIDNPAGSVTASPPHA